jgi:hypothetical protein
VQKRRPLVNFKHSLVGLQRNLSTKSTAINSPAPIFPPPKHAKRNTIKPTKTTPFQPTETIPEYVDDNQFQKKSNLIANQCKHEIYIYPESIAPSKNGKISRRA